MPDETEAPGAVEEAPTLAQRPDIAPPAPSPAANPASVGVAAPVAEPRVLTPADLAEIETIEADIAAARYRIADFQRANDTESPEFALKQIEGFEDELRVIRG